MMDRRGGALPEKGSLLSETDLYLFNEGSHLRLYEKLGSHPTVVDGVPGVAFAVWAPSAVEVSVIGDFNGWRDGSTRLRPHGTSGIWQGFVPELALGAVYKYRILSADGQIGEKADPFGFHHEVPPRTASIVTALDGYVWQDEAWMRSQQQRNSRHAPMSIYEIHLGSWRRDPSRPREFLGYRELAPLVAAYASEMGFTHVELMPVMEHPFYGSWGYQTTGYFAPSARHGTPDDFMYFVDVLHDREIGVILDWVPSHFPDDPHGLARFDGTSLYEHADPRQGLHPDWGSLIFNYGRHEVRSFLLSSAIFWLDKYHVDGLRVDAVASMLYLDYSRREGEWIPNEHGGNENLEAIDFLRTLNMKVYEHFPAVQTIAEESTAWPMVSRPTDVGGLGFGFKWDMGWMHDTLSFLSRDPVHRRHHYNEITFRGIYAFNESFTLPLSHDEVVHGKGSLLARMPGDDWQRFASLRLLFAYQFGQPGKKLLFMGDEFGQATEWSHEASLDWHLADFAPHAGLQRWVARLNDLYRNERSLHELDCESEGFSWVVADDAENSVLIFLRFAKAREEAMLIACNFTPVARENYACWLSWRGDWEAVGNSDDACYGGSGVDATVAPMGGDSDPNVLRLRLPPLAVTFFRGRKRGA
jgi:1,4-alpha-glucan branching enzyme